jgi:hypothetical protein
MSKVSLFTCILTINCLSSYGIGCGGSSGQFDECKDLTNACQTENETRCNSDGDQEMVEICLISNSDCLVWALSEICIESLVCDASTQPAACVCRHGCTLEDVPRCNGDIIQTCQIDHNECRNWVDGLDCAEEGTTCTDTSGIAVCCENHCLLGQTRCQGFVIQSCIEDENNCTFWEDDTNCAELSNQGCDDSNQPAVCLGELDCEYMGLDMNVGGQTGGAADGNDFYGSCAYHDTDCWDRCFYWIAPESKTYKFTTAGSDYDTVLIIYDGDQELNCNDDVNPYHYSEFEQVVEAGKMYTIVIDAGTFADGGFYGLSISVVE